MKQYRISTGSITYALKGRDLLRRNGYKARIERINQQSGGNGCGYSIVVSEEKAVNILRKSGIKILEINEI